MADPRKVFVIHGRDEQARQAVFTFLRALDLQPLEWESIVHATGRVSPSLLEAVTAAFTRAQAVVALLTPDDIVRLHPDLWGAHEPAMETGLMCQARPNVLFEAGMAFGVMPERTLIVQIGEIKPFSDIGGLNYVKLNPTTAEPLQKIAQRLKVVARCAVDDSGTDWLDLSRFAGLDAFRRRP